ncbi:hypothetical protein [Bacteroides xylanisolvens]|uniref:hypothetical protein n=1 Tax=Bacteroides xylanisolvens TaxID=371601 RepID=UPI002307B4F9|nr:hypothetical protein [Bacteroides xylanisolvens]MDB0719510.1 hypothetical protein [Bacteroides xylanisolvens]
MNPIDKFTNIDAVYPITDAKEEDTLLDYVWELAMLIHPALPKKVKGGALEGSVNPEKPDVPLNKNDAFQKVQKRRVQEKR